MNEKSIETLQKQAAEFDIGSLIGRPWAEINDIINKHKENGLILKKLHESKEFQEFCQKQADSFIRRRIALTEKDFKAVKMLWLYGNLELDEIHIIKDRMNDDDYIRSDRFRDFDQDKTMCRLAENVSDIAEELEMPGHLGPKIRTEQRQRLADFVRFMESGQKSREMIKKSDWKELAKEFEHFPRIKSESIIDLYKKAEEKDPNSERLHMMSRIFIYRLYDIDDGKWELKNRNELDALEGFIRESYISPESDDLISRILSKISAARETLDNKSKKSAQPLIIDEERTEEDTVQQKQPSKQEDKKETESNDSEPIESPKKDDVQDDEEQEVKTSPEAAKNKTDEASKKTEPEKEETENWQEEALKNWKDWAKSKRKWIKTYEPETAPKDLAFKIYPNREEAEKGNCEADVHYKASNHMVVKGKPSDEVFDGIVATAKKNSNKIIFGNIKSDEFKARLLLACLKDGNVEIINAPKIDELQNIPDELKEALKYPSQRKTEELKEKRRNLDREREESETGNKSRADNGERRERKRFNRNGDKRRPRREYTEEEKRAYRQRQEAMLHSH